MADMATTYSETEKTEMAQANNDDQYVQEPKTEDKLEDKPAMSEASTTDAAEDGEAASPEAEAASASPEAEAASASPDAEAASPDVEAASPDGETAEAVEEAEAPVPAAKSEEEVQEDAEVPASNSKEEVQDAEEQSPAEVDAPAVEACSAKSPGQEHEEEHQTISCAVMGAAAALLVAGPLAAIAIGGGLAFACSQDDEVGRACRSFGEVGIDLVETVQALDEKHEVSAQAILSATQCLGDVSSKLDEVTEDLETSAD